MQVTNFENIILTKNTSLEKVKEIEKENLVDISEQFYNPEFYSPDSNRLILPIIGNRKFDDGFTFNSNYYFNYETQKVNRICYNWGHSTSRNQELFKSKFEELIEEINTIIGKPELDTGYYSQCWYAYSAQVRLVEWKVKGYKQTLRYSSTYRGMQFNLCSYNEDEYKENLSRKMDQFNN